MALPKRRTSSYRKGKRRQDIKLNLKNLIKCTNCGESRLSHQACPNCSSYAAAK